MPTDNEAIYKEQLHRALEKCQFIEETMKMCLLSVLKISQVKLQSYFPINIQDREINKLSMGRLLNLFKKINNDTVLHRDLESITTDRNKIAHNSLLFTLGELQDDLYMQDKIEEVKNIADLATNIHERLLKYRYQLLRSQSEVERSAV